MIVLNANQRPKTSARARGFTLVELAVVVAVAGILASIGTASMVSVIQSERARNESVRFASDLRRQRADAIQQQMFSYLEIQQQPKGVMVRSASTRFGTAGDTQCQLMASGTADVTSSRFYSGIDIDVTQPADPGGRSLCLDTLGRPVLSAATNVPAPLELNVTAGGRSTLTVSIDAIGALSSSDQPVASGVAQTSFFPLDLMNGESAPVPPNPDVDSGSLPTTEVGPGEFAFPSGAAAPETVGGADDPCAYDATYCDPCVINPMSCYDPYGYGGGYAAY